jgi:hypothetical protein
MHWFNVLWHWVEVHTGTVNEPGPYYGFWSGFGSDIGEVAIIGAIVAGYRKWNCHVKGCLRLAHHTYAIDGVEYHLCRRHHPAIDHKNRKTAGHFFEHHAAKSAPKQQARGPGGRFK